MVKYRCKQCNYTFVIESREMPKICPNCGEKSSLDKERSAQEILEGIE